MIPTFFPNFAVTTIHLMAGKQFQFRSERVEIDCGNNSWVYFFMASHRPHPHYIFTTWLFSFLRIFTTPVLLWVDGGCSFRLMSTGRLCSYEKSRKYLRKLRMCEICTKKHRNENIGKFVFSIYVTNFVWSNFFEKKNFVSHC